MARKNGRWENSRRREELPDDWPKIRARVLKRDGYRCTWLMRSGRRCKQPGTEVDHIGDKHDHSEANLRTLCAHHHTERTGEQAAQAAAAWRAKGRRPPEQHPGSLR
jgi:5-methylcytosine-specific restriction enzyme A